MGRYNWDAANEDLHDDGAPDDIYEYKSDESKARYLREQGLNPERYRIDNNSSSSSNNSSSGCYLTTACVVARGLPDDCFELQTLRKYRDSYLKHRIGGEEDIRYYYDVAPKIVAAIDALENAKEIWGKVYEELIIPCIQCIGKKQYETAYRMYKSYTLHLGDEYL